MLLEPVLEPFKPIADENNLKLFIENDKDTRKNYIHHIRDFIIASAEFIGLKKPDDKILKNLTNVIALIPLNHQVDILKKPVTLIDNFKQTFYGENKNNLDYVMLFYHICLVVENLDKEQKEHQDISRFDNWLLSKYIQKSLTVLYQSGHYAYYDSRLIQILITVDKYPQIADEFKEMLNNISVREFLMVNSYDNKEWFNREQYERLVLALYYRDFIASGEINEHSLELLLDNINDSYRIAESAEYQLDKLTPRFGYK